MKRPLDGDQEGTIRKQAKHTANQRAERLELENRALLEKAELEKRVFDAEKRVLEEKIRALEAEKRALKAEKRLAEVEEKYRLLEVEKRARSHEFIWLHEKTCALPDDLLGKIRSYLADQDLFRLRRVSIEWYRAYFNQQYSRTFNSLRAVRLARMGRVFPRVEKLRLGSGDWGSENPNHSAGDLGAIGPRHFPRLKSLDLGKVVKNWDLFDNWTAINCMPPSPTLENLDCVMSHNDEFGTNKFPALKTLRLGVYCNYGSLCAHSGLEELTLTFHEGSDEFYWNDVSKQNFPKLKELNVCETAKWPFRYFFPDEVRERLIAEGLL